MGLLHHWGSHANAGIVLCGRSSERSLVLVCSPTLHIVGGTLTNSWSLSNAALKQPLLLEHALEVVAVGFDELYHLLGYTLISKGLYGLLCVGEDGLHLLRIQSVNDLLILELISHRRRGGAITTQLPLGFEY